jgi:hypothetical protein
MQLNLEMRGSSGFFELEMYKEQVRGVEKEDCFAFSAD